MLKNIEQHGKEKGFYMIEKVELLAPAGDLEKLKIAIEYGADAVYFGGESFGLRAGSKNFTLDDIREGIKYAHDRQKKVYMTLNIYAHNEDIDALPEYLNSIQDMAIDGLIISDPGIIDLVKEKMPNSEIHLSTQANTTNYRSAKFWNKAGADRVVLARELSLKEIKKVHEKVPELQLETFVHGAMCISYSGRCLLSNYMVQRDANRGECAHPCRWKYYLVEEKRPGEYIPVSEDERGTYFFNSKDLCMIEHIPELIDAGVSSFKIEGRMKSIFYVAVIVGTYRKALDAYYKDPEHFTYQEEWMEELLKVSHRQFTTGFYFDKPNDKDQNYQSSTYVREYNFLGLIKSYDEKSGFATIEQRNKMSIGDEIEVFGPYKDCFKQKIEVMLNDQDEPIESAPHAQQIVKIKMNEPVKENFMIRAKRAGE